MEPSPTQITFRGRLYTVLKDQTVPKDLLAVLRKTGTLAAWETLSFTHQREHVEAIEEAKKPETRQRRIAGCVDMVLKRPEPRASGRRT